MTEPRLPEIKWVDRASLMGYTAPPMGDEGVGGVGFFLIVIVVPLGYVWVMNAFEGIVEWRGLRHRIVKVGWDNCVFSLGGTGALTLASRLTPFNKMVVVTVSGLVVLAVVAVILYIRRRAENPGVTGWHALWALLLSGVAVAIPVWIAYQR